MRNNMKLFVDEIGTWDGFELVAEKMENLIENFEVQGEKVFRANASGDGYNVLNHGEFNINNILFKKGSDGKLSNVLFVSLIAQSFAINKR